ncbi:response regulator [Brevibacterium moorei]|uniref:response regulator n=1 Tax=Brevibacterium moorei TaxID=2968457 RepID=UPI00211B9C9C|nr:response regulator transcription factor [Brevibacterium sp. 68QC2CO]MCQ9386340.1 response regulator transcription factor [Brevibacterium sp. 68QC2CO]
MSETEPITVLLADDQALLRTGFQMVIDSQPDLQVIAQAGTGAEAIAATLRYRPRVVLMDIRMPSGDGIQATREILGLPAGPDGYRPKIIVLTTFDTDDYALRALQAGASGFLLKDTQPEVLLDAIRTVVRGGAVIAPTTTRRLLDAGGLSGGGPAQAEAPTGSSGAASQTGAQIAGVSGSGAADETAEDAETVRLREAVGTLTERELDVFKQIATGRSNKEIADALSVSEATVKTHVGRVFSKLGARDRVQAVVFAYRAGIAG